jgi:hypothetical protein
VGTVPKLGETIGLRATFANKTRIARQGLLVAWGNHLRDGRTVETDTISVTGKPPRQGFLMIPTLTTQVAKRHPPWQHQQQPQQMTQKFLWRFLGIFQTCK